ncbi:dihydropyrimidinase [Humibacter soli]
MSEPAIDPGQAPAELIVYGGMVVNADGRREATVVVDGGRVVALLDPALPVPVAARRIDATGRIVIPGGVDPHCHIGQKLGAYTALDDYEHASIAALWGGTTTMIDFAIPDTYEADPVVAAERRRELAQGSRCDSALHGCIVRWDDGAEAQIEQLVELGIRTIKMFTTYEGVVMASEPTILQVMRALKKVGGLTYVHAEGNHIIRDAQNEATANGTIDASGHAGTRPLVAETTAVSEVLSIAEYVDAPVYFVHQTTPEAVDLVRSARHRGIRAYTETCPHYLYLDESVYKGEHPERFVCSPPIRPAATVAELNRRALTGDIDTIGSDNCCYSTEQKLDRHDDVTEMPNGLPGVETRLPVSFTQLVTDGGLSLERFVALFSTNPARLNGLGGKGAIAVGADADLVILDPHETRTVSTDRLHMPTDYTPYEGRELNGWPQVVVSGGRVVLDEDGFHDPGAVGRALVSEPIAAGLLT